MNNEELIYRLSQSINSANATCSGDVFQLTFDSTTTITATNAATTPTTTTTTLDASSQRPQSMTCDRNGATSCYRLSGPPVSLKPSAGKLKQFQQQQTMQQLPKQQSEEAQLEQQ